MDNKILSRSFEQLTTPLISDACMRLDLPVRLAPQGVRPLTGGIHLAGRVLPVRHVGSVDVFLEAMLGCERGDILVVDNGGRVDEACIGDLSALEAVAHDLAGMIVWGLHRDTKELLEIGLPVFSCGALSAGPRRLDPRDTDALVSAILVEETVTRDDVVFADDDGIVFVSAENVETVLAAAEAIRGTERAQADRVRSGTTLTTQLRFESYLRKRRADPTFTFRQHLREIGGAIEE